MRIENIEHNHIVIASASPYGSTAFEGTSLPEERYFRAQRTNYGFCLATIQTKEECRYANLIPFTLQSAGSLLDRCCAGASVDGFDRRCQTG
jgi:hypothetical protein